VFSIFFICVLFILFLQFPRHSHWRKIVNLRNRPEFEHSYSEIYSIRMVINYSCKVHTLQQIIKHNYDSVTKTQHWRVICIKRKTFYIKFVVNSLRLVYLDSLSRCVWLVCTDDSSVLSFCYRITIFLQCECRGNCRNKINKTHIKYFENTERLLSKIEVNNNYEQNKNKKYQCYSFI
jgi:hypothetical protein